MQTMQEGRGLASITAGGGEDRAEGGRREAAVVLGLIGLALALRLAPLAVHLAVNGQLQPYHSGGLFYFFCEAIRANGFLLPSQIPYYTEGGLPFAYPPLSFYLGALVLQVFGGGPSSLLALNAALSTAAVIAFVRVADAAGLRGAGKYCALLAFATLDRLFVEQAQGAGLAEAFGTLTMVLFVDATLRFVERPSARSALWLGASLALAVISSPGAAYAAPFTIVLAIALGLGLGDAVHRRRLLAFSLLAAGTSLVVAAPYLLHLWQVLGLTALWEALQDQDVATPTLETLAVRASRVLLPQTPAITKVPFWHMLAVLGMVYAAVSRRWFWLLWPLFIASVRREGPWLAMLPIAVLAGMTLQEVLLPGLERLRAEQFRLGRLRLPRVETVLVCLALYMVVTGPVGYIGVSFETNDFDVVGYVGPGQAVTLRALAETTPPDTRLVVSGDVIEWAPYLAQRTVVNVPFGTEWVVRKRWAINLLNNQLRVAKSGDDVLAALAEAQRYRPEFFPTPDLLYVAKQGAPGGKENYLSPEVVGKLSADRRFTRVYEDDGAVVFQLPSRY